MADNVCIALKIFDKNIKFGAGLQIVSLIYYSRDNLNKVITSEYMKDFLKNTSNFSYDINIFANIFFKEPGVLAFLSHANQEREDFIAKEFGESIISAEVISYFNKVIWPIIVDMWVDNIDSQKKKCCIAITKETYSKLYEHLPSSKRAKQCFEDLANWSMYNFIRLSPDGIKIDLKGRVVLTIICGK